MYFSIHFNEAFCFPNLIVILEMPVASRWSFDHLMSFWSGRSASKQSRLFLIVCLTIVWESSPSILILSVNVLSARRFSPVAPIHSISMLHDFELTCTGRYSSLLQEDNKRAEISIRMLIPKKGCFIFILLFYCFVECYCHLLGSVGWIQTHCGARGCHQQNQEDDNTGYSRFNFAFHYRFFRQRYWSNSYFCR